MAAPLALIPNVDNSPQPHTPPNLLHHDHQHDQQREEDEEEKAVVVKDEEEEEEHETEEEIPLHLQDKVLREFKSLVRHALDNHHFSPPPPKPHHHHHHQQEAAPIPLTSTPDAVPPVADNNDDGAKTVEAIEDTVVAISSIPTAPPPREEEQEEEEKSPEEISIWGIPLLADDRSDALLFKFLQARDFKPKEALAMLKKTVLWRKEFDIEGLLHHHHNNPSLQKFAYLDGFSKSGNPVCYNKFGAFQDKEMYRSTFADTEKRKEFLRWRVQLLEKSIRKMLDFRPGGVCTFVQVNDFRNSPFLLKKELRTAIDEGLQLLQDNYPEFISKQIFINVPWWYVAFMTVINPFLTQRTKSKFVFVGPAKSTETLFKYIAPEQVPVEYGGFSKEGEQEFTTADPVTEEIIKPSSPLAITLPFSEACNSVWEVRVSGWDVSYGAEFVPSVEDGFTVIVQKLRKVGQGEETVICGSFKVDGPGKIVLTFNNPTSKKKRLFYRSKTKPSAS